MRVMGKMLQSAGLNTHLVSYDFLRSSPAENAAKLHAEIAALNVKTIHLVGHSLGGIVILHILKAFPDLPLGKVLRKVSTKTFFSDPCWAAAWKKDCSAVRLIMRLIAPLALLPAPVFWVCRRCFILPAKTVMAWSSTAKLNWRMSVTRSISRIRILSWSFQNNVQLMSCASSRPVAFTSVLFAWLFVAPCCKRVTID